MSDCRRAALGAAMGAVVLCSVAGSAATAGAPTTQSDRARAFAIRGIKGCFWDGLHNYRLALPWLAEHKLNFLMLCYTSFPASASDWRADYNPAELRGLRKLASQARKLNVHLCLSFNPGVYSKPPLVYSSEEDYQAAWRKVRVVHALGIHWFGLCLDDISRALEPVDVQRFGTLQAAQVHYVNRLWRDMKALSPRPKLIFCPSAYLTDDARHHQDYITAIGREVDPEVMVFWTGPQCCSPSITAADARLFGEWIQRKPFVWDNYPVSDMYGWRPLLGPVKNRSSDLGGAVSGYLANPSKHWHASKIPLATLALYLNDPAGYDPGKAIEQVIRSYPRRQQPAIRGLVERYGASFWGEPGFPSQPRAADCATAARLLPEYWGVRDALAGDRGLRELWQDVRATLERDIAFLERKSRDRAKVSPLRACGDDFEGGAGEVFGFRFYNRDVNYVYAESTGRHEMRVILYVEHPPAGDVALRLDACHADTGSAPGVRITLGDHVLFEGASQFAREAFAVRRFVVPASALKPGANVLTIRNLEPAGPLGMPPFFMVAAAELVLAGE